MRRTWIERIRQHGTAAPEAIGQAAEEIARSVFRAMENAMRNSDLAIDPPADDCPKPLAGLIARHNANVEELLKHRRGLVQKLAAFPLILLDADVSAGQARKRNDELTALQYDHLNLWQSRLAEKVALLEELAQVLKASIAAAEKEHARQVAAAEKALRKIGQGAEDDPRFAEYPDIAQRRFDYKVRETPAVKKSVAAIEAAKKRLALVEQFARYGKNYDIQIVGRAKLEALRELTGGGPLLGW